jgi:hypothetical protein
MRSKSYVRESAHGGWEVLKEGDRAPRARTATKDQAIRRARTIVERDGGGDVRVLNRAGKVVAERKVGTTTRTTKRT